MASSTNGTQDAAVCWPSLRIPVEIFVEIGQNLPDRKDLKSMRLVNKEFNSRILFYFFRQVAIRFDQHHNAIGPVGQVGPTANTLLDGQIFSIFAPEIRHLHISLLLDEDCIHNEELEHLMVGQSTFLGIRRWLSNRMISSLLKRVIELQTESRGIFGILTNLEKIQTIQLSLETGLGYLMGTDRLETRSSNWNPPSGGIMPSTNDYKAGLHRYLAANGVALGDIPTGLLEENGNVSLDEYGYEKRTKAALPTSRYEQEITRPLVMARRNKRMPLHPEALSSSQALGLYELMVTRKAIFTAMVDTLIIKGPQLTQLTKLCLSPLSSYYIKILSRDSFWSSLPYLEDVSLGITPDWRSLSDPDPEDFTQPIRVRQVYPTDAMPIVYKLIKDHIASNPRITHFHFEWTCGGELAPGYVQRNNHVLPAPFLKDHRRVVDARPENLLKLPHITHLSLKNCWFAPHVFYNFIRTMAKDGSLQFLDLETVSLSGPPIFRAQLPEYTPPKPLLTRPHDVDPPTPRQAPPEWSWPHIIDMITPGPTYKQYLHTKGDITRPLTSKKEFQLQKLTFKSCGYVLVPDTRHIDSTRLRCLEYTAALVLAHLVAPQSFGAARPRLWREMIKCVQITTDPHLGTVVDAWAQGVGCCVMHDFFGFSITWAYGPGARIRARDDGVIIPGGGRFSGILERSVLSRGEEWRAEGESEKGEVYGWHDERIFQDYDSSAGWDEMMTSIERSQGYVVPEMSDEATNS